MMTTRFKRFAAVALALAACQAPAPPTAAPPVNAPTAAPLQPSATPRATNTLVAPTPIPTDTPVPTPAPNAAVVTYTYRVVNSFPHDPQAFTQGLVAEGNTLYESTGLKGRSSLREVDLVTGNVRRIQPVDPLYFAEGLARIGDKLFQLTWQEKTGYVYDRATFTIQRSWQYEGEGWGLAYDGAQLIMSDGTPVIRFLDPESLQTTRTINVTYFGQPQPMLNELEYINGVIYANIWQTDRIVQIDPRDGRVVGVIDMTGLLKPEDRTAPVDVLNGIAFDPVGKRLLVTGKLWPKLFEIQLVPAQ